MSGHRPAALTTLRSSARRLRTALTPAGPAESTPSTGGHPPEVEHVATHLGPLADDLVERSVGRMRVGVDPDYDLVQARFDPLHYILQGPGLLERRPRVDLVEHFLQTGEEHRRDPEPDFSMERYLERHPEHAEGAGGAERSPYLEWLKRGRAAGEIADPSPGIEEMAAVLGREPGEVAELLSARRRDLLERFRTGRLGEMLAKAAEVEPLIGATWTEVGRPRMLPFSNAAAAGQVAAIHRCQSVAGTRRARMVLVINRPRWGGGRRIEGHLAHGLSSGSSAALAPEDIVVIHTDDAGETPPGRYPDGVREIDFAGTAAGLAPEDAQAALVVLLRSFRADCVVNINSRMLHRAMQAHGKALAASERIFLCFFCNEQSATGTWHGWSLRHFYRAFDEVAGVITDSQFLADQLTDTYQVPPGSAEKLQVFRAPVDPGTEPAQAPGTSSERRPQVFWAGRWDRQKRVGLFLDLARRMPDVDFRMWGESVMTGGRQKVPSNVTKEGRYGHFSELPLDEADAWLYTSGWDGVPSQLLEVAMTGVPVVGTDVGGTGEVIGREDAWPVPEDAGAEAYEEALRAVLADPVSARRRSAALRERMLAERTGEDFAAHAADVLLLDPPLHERPYAERTGT